MADAYGRQPAAFARGPVVVKWEQYEVLALLAAGWSSRQIAAALYVTRAAVNTRIQRLFDALGCARTAPAAVAAGYDVGLLPAVGFTGPPPPGDEP